MDIADQKHDYVKRAKKDAFDFLGRHLHQIKMQKPDIELGIAGFYAATYTKPGVETLLELHTTQRGMIVGTRMISGPPPEEYDLDAKWKGPIGIEGIKGFTPSLHLGWEAEVEQGKNSKKLRKFSVLAHELEAGFEYDVTESGVLGRLREVDDSQYKHVDNWGGG